MRRRAVWLLLLAPLLVPAVAFALADLTVTPTEVAFAARCVRTTAPPKKVTVTNEGNRDATDVRVAVSPAAFATIYPLSGSTAVPTMTPEASATFSVRFVPGKAGDHPAAAVIRYETKKGASEEEPSPEPEARVTTVPLSGDGIDRFIDASPRVLNFGDLRVGRSSDPRRVTIFDDGDSPLTITGISIVGRHADDFSVSPRRGRTITEGSPLRLALTFTARGSGARTAILRVTSNACTDPTVEVDLAGVGVVPDIIALPGRIDFEPRVVGKQRTEELTIANQGGAALRVTRLRLRGEDADHFRILRAPTLPRTLDPGASVDMRVRFTANEPGERRARVVVESSDPDTKRLRVALTGTVEAEPTPSPTPVESVQPSPSPSPEPEPPRGPSLFSLYGGELALGGGVVGFFVLLVVVRRLKGVPD